MMYVIMGSMMYEIMGSMMYEIMDNIMYGQHNDHEQHDDAWCSMMVLHSKVQQMDEMKHYDRWRSHLRESVEAICLQLISVDIKSQSVDFYCKCTTSLPFSTELWRT